MSKKRSFPLNPRYKLFMLLQAGDALFCLLGIVSLISLAVLSYERYSTMMAPTEADPSNYRKISLGIGLSWGYSLIWTLPPLLGWSHYGPEGPGTTCSVDWTEKSANNISYIICLFVFCLIVPFLVIVFCYGKLLCAIRQVSVLVFQATDSPFQFTVTELMNFVSSSYSGQRKHHRKTPKNSKLPAQHQTSASTHTNRHWSTVCNTAELPALSFYIEFVLVVATSNQMFDLLSL